MPSQGMRRGEEAWRGTRSEPGRPKENRGKRQTRDTPLQRARKQAGLKPVKCHDMLKPRPLQRREKAKSGHDPDKVGTGVSCPYKGWRKMPGYFLGVCNLSGRILA